MYIYYHSRLDLESVLKTHFSMHAAIAYIRLLSIIIIVFFQLVDYQQGLFTSLRSCKSEYIALRCLQLRPNDGNDTGIISTGGSLKVVFVGINWLLIQICENGHPFAITWISLQIEFNAIALYDIMTKLLKEISWD